LDKLQYSKEGGSFVSKGSGETTVIQYVLKRLKDLGVTEAFGFPGDFVYPVCDAICDDPGIIICSDYQLVLPPAYFLKR